MKRWLLAMVCVLALAGGVRAADEAAAQEAIEAQQELQRAELVVALPPVIGPEVRAVQILHRNLSQVRLEVVSQETEQVVFARDYPLRACPEYTGGETEVALPALALGDYRFIFSTNGNLSSEPLREELTVQVATFTVAVVGVLDEGEADEAPAMRFFVGDTRTGEAVVGARVRVVGREGVSDEQGVACVSLGSDAAEAPWSKVAVEARGERVVFKLDGGPMPERAKVDGAAKRFEWMAQRPLYRPGETLCFELLGLRQKVGAAAEVLAGEEVELRLELRGEDEEEALVLLQERVKLSAYGSWRGQVVLPPDRTGRVVAFVGETRCGQVKVLAFRPAAFAVDLECASVGVPLDLPQRFVGRAVEHSGLPLKSGAVRWRSGSHRGVCAVQADGAFAFEVPPELEWKPANAFLEAEVIVTRENGEWQEASWGGLWSRLGYRMEAVIPERVLEGVPFEVEVMSAYAQASGVLRFERRDWAAEVVRVPVERPGTVRVTLPAGNWMVKLVAGEQEAWLGWSWVVRVMPASGEFPFGPEAKEGTLQVSRVETDYAAGEVVEGYADIPGEGACFLQVLWREAQRTRVAVMALPPSRRFAWQVPPGVEGRVYLEVYGFDHARFYRYRSALFLRPASGLQVQAKRISEREWEVTVDDPRAEVLATGYDSRMEGYGGALPWRRFRLEVAFDDELPFLKGVWLKQPQRLACLTLCEALPALSLPQARASRRRLWGRPWGPLFEQAYKRWGLERPIVPPRERFVRSPSPEQPKEADPFPDIPWIDLSWERARFAPAALGEPQVRVESDRAVFRMTVPEEATWWRFCVFAHTPDGRSGFWYQEIKVRD